MGRLVDRLASVGALQRAASAWMRQVGVRGADWAAQAALSVPGAAGALMLSWGLGLMYRPLLWVALGIFALAVDRRMP